ncbi:preprotein translocase subunit SecY [Candidatus Saccharibacteria bacterium]|nr:MAG: preprotein translocase subunit SecY [Candidatus Saccharibacteria bacterium]
MNWRIIWKSLGRSDMRNRILAVLGILLLSRVLAHIPVPLASPETLKQVLTNLFNAETPQFLSFLDVLSGGALANFSIILVGLGPYINASIIMQLLSRAIPQLEQIQKDGEYGRKKINQYTRMLTLPLAIIQSVGAIYLIRQYAQQVGGIGDITANTSMMQWVLMVAALTGGAMIMMWLGEMITEQGIGNGISLLITIGIVSGLPSTISSIAGSVFDGQNKWVVWGNTLPMNAEAFRFAAIILVVVVLMTMIIVTLNEGARRLTINYAKRVQGNRAYGGVTTTLPVKMITAGVIPIIFALAFLSLPSFIGQLLINNSSARLQELGNNLYTWFQAPTSQTLTQGGWEPFIYPVAYFLLVFLFTFFYTSITFNAHDIAENLQKQGGFIDGVRSGSATEKYLGRVVNRLTLFGGLALGLLAVSPIIGQYFLNTNITIGGTSLLILVAVALETLRSVESRALMVTYDQYEQADYFTETDEPKRRGLRRLAPRRRKRRNDG